jgi:hypothetical protein
MNTISTRMATGSKPTRVYKILDIHCPLTLPEQGVFQQCPENELKSLELRHLVPVPDLLPIHEQRLKQLAAEFAAVVMQDYEYCKLTELQVLNGKVGPDRKRYARAFSNIRRGWPLNPELSAFLKMEKFADEKLRTKPPRMIQYPSYEYMAEMTRMLKPIDKRMLSCPNLFRGQVVETMMGTGVSQEVIAERMWNHWSSFKDPVAIGLDAVHFDAHVVPGTLRVEFTFDKIIIGQKANHTLLDKQLSSHGKTQFGIRYKVKGKRASGQYNTGMGNTTISILFLVDVMERCGITNYKIIVNGDDSVLFVESVDVPVILLNYRLYFGDLSMDMKLDKISYVFEDIEFCQCQPVWRGDRWVMIRKPERLMARSALMVEDFSKSLDRYLSSVALCELANNVGIPILQSFSLHLLQLSGCARPLANCKDYKSKFEPSIELKSISNETRESFYRAFGIDIPTQVAMEESLGQSISSDINQFLQKYKNFHQTGKDDPVSLFSTIKSFS